MGFMNEYKRLEKLCRDIYGDEKPVKAYIMRMEDKPDGVRWVTGWNADLKQLKHYLWVRNQISHNPDCTEENMCDYEDEQWITDFYNRIMAQTDPLTLYRKARQPQPTKPPVKTNDQYNREVPQWEEEPEEHSFFRDVAIAVVVGMGVFLLLLFFFLKFINIF